MWTVLKYLILSCGLNFVHSVYNDGDYSYFREEEINFPRSHRVTELGLMCHHKSPSSLPVILTVVQRQCYHSKPKTAEKILQMVQDKELEGALDVLT